MTMPYTIQDVRNIILRPHAGQFVIDELPLIFMCMAGLVYGGMEGMPLGGMATVIALFLFLVLLYRFICLRRICYRVGNEQLVCERGLFCRRVDYMELYRIVDFQEHQSLFICNPNNRAIIFHSDMFFYLCNQGVEEEIGSAEEQPISNKLLDDMQ